ncbi:MAG: tRNA epoxyqueuosine(34) reductase QueG [Bacteroidota bacterium]|nr:tRNA epoxyqueuosine(34) reductase QueG [Bacteroidota bacterium]MDP4234195.1 tRNA epoxyqueuosine(34) reductase QueG [Bacteroidota bacterium]MDP4243739.1 tRNA epoxyqueuosine(34) reductase QueG [Bacteroidota bacterium]MDP4287896.1 tRNA epoxyqueuosine(34) reductase QueG [Bacteroidota bacterium]
MTREEITLHIKAKALETGFTKAGVTSVEPLNDAADRLRAWVADGAHGVMQWMERRHDERRDVRNLMPDAKSILSLAINYYHPHEIDPASDHKISRYAWGTDYHEVVPPMLKHLLEEIQMIVPEAVGRYYTDTGPLLERELAERAGIGWIGKHSSVITREAGSWVFLAEIILNLDLEPDPPAEDMCGTCTRCIDACPTDAITEPYKIDARRCIAYLTIELKPEHEIPSELASKLNGWIYGCDICQDVCPWNRFAQPTAISAFAPREGVLSLDCETIETMEQEEFSSRFSKSPMKRAKLAGLKRNIRAAKQNQ